MILNKRILKIFCKLLMILIIPTFSHAEIKNEDWRKEFSMRLRQMALGEIGAEAGNLSDEILEQQASIIPSDSTMPALLELWLRNKSCLEFFWWKQESRATRCFIMALYPEAIFIPENRPFPLSAGPDFNYNITRFNKREEIQRIEEKLFVREHLSSISELIIKILKTKNIDKSRYSLFQTFLEKNIGDPLPGP